MTARHLQNLRGDSTLQQVVADAAIISTLDLIGTTKLNSLTTPMVPGDTVGVIGESGNADFTFADQFVLGDVDLTAGATFLNAFNFVDGDVVAVTGDQGTGTFTFNDPSVTGNVDLGDGSITLEDLTGFVNGNKVGIVTDAGGATTHTVADIETETVADVVASLNANTAADVTISVITGFLTVTATDGGDLVLTEVAEGTNWDDLGLAAGTTDAPDVDDLLAVIDGITGIDSVLDVSDFLSIIAVDGGSLVLDAGDRWADLGLSASASEDADTVADVVAAWNAVTGITCTLSSSSSSGNNIIITATDGGLLTIDEGGQGTNLDDLGFAVTTVLGFEERPKTWTVPDGKAWKLQSLYAACTHDATAGARQYVLEIKDASGSIVQNIVLGVTQIASLTRNYTMGIGLPNLTTLVDTTELTTPLPDIWLPEGYVIRFFDNNAVDAVDDIVLVRAMVQER